MDKLRLEKLVEELDKDVYNIAVSLGPELAVIAKKESEQTYPKNYLSLVDSGIGYFCDLSMDGSSLESSYKLLDRAGKGELNLFVGTEEEFRNLDEDEKPEYFDTAVILSGMREEGEGLTEEKRAELTERVVDLIKSTAETNIDNRELFLSRLESNLNPDLRKIINNKLRVANDYDRELADDYDQRNGNLERVEQFVDSSKRLKFLGNAYNTLTFGRHGKKLLQEIDLYAERRIAWAIIREKTEKMSQAVRHDLVFLEAVGKGELANKLKGVASFYGNISYQANFGVNRMDHLLRRTVKLYEKIIELEAPDVERISLDLVNKMSGYVVRYSLPLPKTD